MIEYNTKPTWQERTQRIYDQNSQEMRKGRTDQNQAHSAYGFDRPQAAGP